MSTSNLPKVINIDGVEYEVENLNPTVKRLLSIYQLWEKDTNDSRLQLAKNEAALRDLTREIQTSIKQNSTDQVNSQE